VQFSLLAIALSAHRFAPRSASPLLLSAFPYEVLLPVQCLPLEPSRPEQDPTDRVGGQVGDDVVEDRPVLRSQGVEV